MYSTAVLVGGVVVGFVWNVRYMDLGKTAMKYFPDVTSIDSRINPIDFPNAVRINDNFALLNRW
jgi:hypothetical protein